MEIPFDLVQRQLEALEKEENVQVLLAVESGSRAWGFPSADSDFDVRFLYLRHPDWYLSIDEGRDVIERPIDENAIDLSGWDLKKALKLFRKSNPPLLEWLQSPILYQEKYSSAQKLRELLPSAYSPLACFHHYLSMAQGNFRQYLQTEEVRVKKYFYVLRPVLGCLWIESGLGPVPIEFSRLLTLLPVGGPVRVAIDELLEKKIAGAELDRGPRIPELNKFVETELSRLSQTPPAVQSTESDTVPLNRLFRASLQEVWK